MFRNTIKMIAVVATALGLSAPRPATAQQTWQHYAHDAVRSGAAFCPINDTTKGQYFCFALRCAPDGPLGWEVFYNGGAVPGGAVEARLTVDGRAAPPMTFTPQDSPGQIRLTAPWIETRDNPLATQLQRGQAALLDLRSPSWQVRYTVPLAGANAAIARVREACPLPPPPPIADPAAQARAEHGAFCADMGAQLLEEEGFVTTPDLNGDGRADLVLQWGALSCSTGGSGYCGSAGCRTGLFTALPGGGYREVLDSNVRGFEAEVMPVITLHLHGNACGKVGVERCVKYFRLDALGGLEELD